ncbi:hypothetical protein GC175_26720 [bacterium]|nr:hypothetical protein [bacterium]
MTTIHLEPAVTSPAQSLCMRCGLCCDGTLFEWARVVPDDDPAQLDAGGFVLQTHRDRQRFELPCHHQQSRICTIYQQWRPSVCHHFKCGVLRRMEAGELSVDEAQALILRTVKVADRVWAQLRPHLDDQIIPLKASMQSLQSRLTEQGSSIHATFASLMLDYAALQRYLDRDFRIKPDKDTPPED